METFPKISLLGNGVRRQPGARAGIRQWGCSTAEQESQEGNADAAAHLDFGGFFSDLKDMHQIFLAQEIRVQTSLCLDLSVLWSL